MIFAYQSFNASVSSTHDLNSLNGQRFTVMTHNHLATQDEDPRALVFPTVKSNPSTPVLGPPNLVPTEPTGAMSKGKVTNDAFFGMMQQKVLQIPQTVYRELGGMPNVLAFGELDSANDDVAMMTDVAGPEVGSSGQMKKACQNFSVFSHDQSNVNHLGDGEGWFAIEYLSYVVVFVHVPNAIATKKDPVVKFYQNIQSQIQQHPKGGIIDVVIGDTNQPSPNFTPNCLSQALQQNFQDAHGGATINPMDTFGVEVSGTNAKGTQKYDVAVFNTKTVKAGGVSYWTQRAPFGSASSVGAVTDHMGLAVKVEKLISK